MPLMVLSRIAPDPRPERRAAAGHGAWDGRRARAARRVPSSPDRRLRLRGRGPHGPPRAPRVPPARGLRVPRRHGPVPVRRALAGRARALLRRDRRGAHRPRREAARGCVQHGDGGGPAGAARADDGDDARDRRARRRAPRGGRRGGGDAQRAHRLAGDAGDGAERRLRRGPRGGRSARHARRGAVPRPRTDHPARLPVRRRRRRDGAGVRRAAARGGRRHGDPRLHPLPAHPADAPAHARPGRGDRHVGQRARASGRARAQRAVARQSADRRGGRLPLPVHRRRRCVPGARHALPPASARRRRAGGAAGGGHRVTRSYDRGPDALRPTTIEPGFVRTATGSALISMGETRVICTASHQTGVPRWLAGSGRGWVTAEYGMLPASTGERKQRDVTRGRPDGRTVEIQRLIGRSLRGVVDFAALGEHTIYLDCDVLQADGGTRTASITGAYVALALACEKLVAEGLIARTPLTGSVAAISCGVVDGVPLLDLDYVEDSSAEVDANVVMTGDGGLVEVQATAERTPLSRAHLDALLALAERGITRLRVLQDEAIAAGRAAA